MCGHLYQLFDGQFKRLPSGAVRIDGPWDKYGLFVKAEKQENGTYLIRGTGGEERKPKEIS